MVQLCIMHSSFFSDMFQPPSPPLSASTPNNFEANAQNRNNSFEDISEENVPGARLSVDQECQKVTAKLIKGNQHLTFYNTYFITYSDTILTDKCSGFQLSLATRNNIFEDNSQNLNDSFDDNSDDDVPGARFVDQQIRKKTTANLIKGNHNFTRNNT